MPDVCTITGGTKAGPGADAPPPKTKEAFVNHSHSLPNRKNLSPPVSLDLPPIELRQIAHGIILAMPARFDRDGTMEIFDMDGTLVARFDALGDTPATFNTYRHGASAFIVAIQLCGGPREKSVVFAR